jgi:hypothetical protein
MIIGIVGSRRRNNVKDYSAVKEAFFKIYKPGDSICSGGCPLGADKFAEIIAETYQIPIIIYPAEWDLYGRGAGFIRNTTIAETSDHLIACVAEDRTGGTEDTIRKYVGMGKHKPIIV